MGVGRVDLVENKTFNHFTIQLPPKLGAKMVGNKRLYLTPQGAYYPSVTSVLAVLDEAGIKKWRDEVGEKMADYISFKATSTGTEMHKIIEEYLNNRLDITKYKKLLPKAHFENIKPHLNQIDNILASEATLYSDRLKLAGTTDCVADFEGELSIIDFKTASKKKNVEYIEKYILQATCYSIMFAERTGVDVPNLVILISGEDGSTDVFKSKREANIERLERVLGYKI